MNILHVVPTFYPALAYGGPMRALYDLCRALADAGETVRVLTTDADGAKRIPSPKGLEVEISTRAGSSVRILYARRRWRQTISPELMRLLVRRMRWADVAHLTAIYSFPTLPTLLAARLTRTQLVLSPRGSFGPWGQQRRRVEKAPYNLVLRRLARRGVTFHATAATEAADIRAVMGDVPVAVVPNGIDTSEFTTLPDDGAARLRKAAGLRPEDAPLIGCLGRIHEKKGLDRLVGAVPLLLGQWPRLHVAIAGPDDGRERARLETLADRLGVRERVRFLDGMYEVDRVAFLSGLDVFVLPSLDENFANAVAEALATGTPVVASRNCPWPELEDLRCGRWIDATAEAVAVAVSTVLTDDARSMGARGRNFVMSERTIGKAAEAMRQVYEGMSRRRPERDVGVPV